MRIGYHTTSAFEALGRVGDFRDGQYQDAIRYATPGGTVFARVRVRCDRSVRTLGAIFAGGAARRFGSDKAAALLHGRALLDHVAGRLAAQSDAVVVVGRDWPGLPSISDRPGPGLGPLGALAGALCFARDHGYDQVLTSGCDLPDLPHDLIASLGTAPAVVAGQPLLGLWGTGSADRLLAWIATSPDRSMRGWIAHSGARTVTLDRPIANINRVGDLMALKLDPASGE